MGFYLTGIEGQILAREPIERRRCLNSLFFLKLPDEAMEAGAVFSGHIDELKAHAVIGAAMADNAACTDFSASDVEQDFRVGTGREWVGVEEEHTADAKFFGPGDIAFAGALPGNQHTLRRAKARRATSFVFKDFDGEILYI